MIDEKNCSSASAEKSSNLYTDLSFDSLSFITLLLEIESAYSITLEILEMESCLCVENLIAIVEKKVKEVNDK